MPDATEEPHPPLPLLPSIAPTEGRSRGRAILYLTIVLLVVGLLWFLVWFFYMRFHATTDDAYVNGNMINITSVIPGTPIAFFADNTDLVEEGQLLIQLDSTEYRIAYEKELCTLAATVLKTRQLYDNVKEAHANMGVKKAQLDTARFNYEHRLPLQNTGGVSAQELNQTKDALVSAKKQLKQAEYQFDMAQDAAGNTTIEEHPLITEQKAVVREAFYRLQHCSIYAPVTGYVAQRAVQVGQWASPNTALMAIIPLSYIWVDANYKETELTDMRIGQPAVVTCDIYGSGVKYKGHVLGIGFGTGSVFSLIPPQNATGNWIKIVQRVPVRISVDPETMKKYPLRLGLSAYVDVNITDIDLPMIAQTPSISPIGSTTVFELQMGEVEAVMNRILHENLASANL